MKPNSLLLAGFIFLAATLAPAATLYVDAASTNAVSPYTNWLTAAAVIQDAVDAATPGDEVVVTNGVYATGGRRIRDTAGPFGSHIYMTNRVHVDKPLILRSVNGPEATVISGNAAARCAYLTNGVVMSGFMLTNGIPDWNALGAPSAGGIVCESNDANVTNCIITGNVGFDGGGASSGTLNNCILVGNRASHVGGGACASSLNNCTIVGNSAQSGGGVASNTLNKCTLMNNTALNTGGAAYSSTLNNCTIISNTAGTAGGAFFGTLNNCVLSGNSSTAAGGGGGGAASATLNNCTLSGNSAAQYGGATALGTYLNNCIVYSNTAGGGFPNCWGSSLEFCCTTPMPSGGTGNITNEPAFVDLAGGNLRLQASSPCINVGNNAYVTSDTDLDGRVRIVDGSVDMGAYEHQGPGMSEFLGWLAQFSLPTDGTADFTDGDHDGFNNYQEYRCGTVPTNALSFLCVLPPAPAGADVTLSWPSGTGRSYVLECSTNLGSTPPFLPLATHLPGQPGTTRFTITNAAAAPPRFYRVGAE